jgi:hypothetical protein
LHFTTNITRVPPLADFSSVSMNASTNFPDDERLIDATKKKPRLEALVLSLRGKINELRNQTDAHRTHHR